MTIKLKMLNSQEVTSVYHSCLLNDFPSDERKPLPCILDAMDGRTYLPLGAFENDTLIGYAFFVETGNNYLLDYFAIVPQKRNQGYGSQLLRQLHDSLKDAASILAEVENPAFADSETDAEIQTRRLNFYLRNGFRNTEVNVNTFGVNYLLLDLIAPSTSDQTKLLYQRHYRAMLPEKMFQEMI